MLAGRSLWRINDAARENGYLTEIPAFLMEEDAGYLPHDKVLIICTGSQGEPRAALSRIAADDHPRVTMGSGDVVIFSSRIIPGNEPAISKLQDKLVRRGIKVITAKDHMIHVSGHPARDELTRMYQHVRPRISVPVHGELRHLVEHAELARQCQVPEAFVIENGTALRLGPATPGIIDHVPAGRLVADGSRIVPADGETIKSRIRTIWNGFSVVTVALNGEGLKGEPQISTTGLFEDENNESLDDVRLAVRKALAKLSSVGLKDDKLVHETARIAARRALHLAVGKRPVIRVHLVRLS